MMVESTANNQSGPEVQPSLEQRLAALEGRYTEIQKQNIDLRKNNDTLQCRIRTLEVRLATTEDTMINLSPINLGKQTHKAFALFSKLPPELRKMIWIFARPLPRVVNIFQTKVGGKDVLYSTAKIPALLQGCQESRRIAKTWYQLSFPWYLHSYAPDAARVYFDFSSDFIYFPDCTYGKEEMGHSRLLTHFVNIYDVHRAKVKKVIHEVTRSLENLTLISIAYPFATEALFVEVEEGMSKGGAEQSEFVICDEPFLWQGNKTLFEIYQGYSKREEDIYKELSWNLASIQRARFRSVEKEK